jgi:demethylmenaquinone methyltransferase/2-methoxy-6-polyprenyl-1,4-benzoquinol methylase
VLSTGGRFVIVETRQPRSRLIRPLYHLYLNWFALRVGHWLSGNRGAYRYLAQSALGFFPAEEVSSLLLDAGFKQVTFLRLRRGTIAIHTAVR